MQGPITVKWTGKLRIVPLEGERDAALVPGKALVRLTGTPVVITHEDMRAQSGIVAFNSANGTASLQANGIVPMVTMTLADGANIATPSLTYVEQPEGKHLATLIGESRAVMTSKGAKDPLTLTELVRAQLRRALTFKLTRGAGQLGIVLIDPMIEDSVRRAITRTPAGAFLTLPPAQARDVVAALRRAAGEAAGQQAGPTIFLTQPDIRRFMRKLIETELADATVVSFAELLPEVTLRPLARANLAGLG
jgi:hypothetical protein